MQKAISISKNNCNFNFKNQYQKAILISKLISKSINNQP